VQRAQCDKTQSIELWKLLIYVCFRDTHMIHKHTVSTIIFSVSLLIFFKSLTMVALWQAWQQTVAISNSLITSFVTYLRFHCVCSVYFACQSIVRLFMVKVLSALVDLLYGNCIIVLFCHLQIKGIEWMLCIKHLQHKQQRKQFPVSVYQLMT